MKTERIHFAVESGGGICGAPADGSTRTRDREEVTCLECLMRLALDRLGRSSHAPLESGWADHPGP